MAAEEDKGAKNFIRAIAVPNVPALLCPGASRLHMMCFNEGPSPVRVGPSGTVGTTQYILIPSGQYFFDYYSDDDWWAMVAPGGASGTVSGFFVVGL